MSHEDQSFVRTAGIVLAALVGISLLAFVLANSIGENTDGADPLIVAQADTRIAPVGETAPAHAVEVEATEQQPAVETHSEPAAAEPAVAEPVDIDGAKVVQTYCFACHGTGLPGSPQVGDAAAWSERIAKGSEELYNSAINGKISSTGVMPPKGGMMNLSDEQVKAAVDYMVSQSQ